MQRTTVIGTGMMGTAMCQALVAHGSAVTAWNRSGRLSSALTAVGIEFSSDLADAVQASPVIIVVIANYRAARDLLGGLASDLAGRTIVNPMIGTGSDAREFADYVHMCGGTYLDAGVECYPQDIGSADALINFCGDESAWEECRHVLQGLAGGASYLGNDPASAMLAEAVTEAFINPTRGAFLEAASFADAVGLSLDAVLPTILHTLKYLEADLLNTAVPAIENRNFVTTQASLDVELSATRAYRQQMLDAGQRATLMTANMHNLEIAQAAGHGSASAYAAYLTNGSPHI